MEKGVWTKWWRLIEKKFYFIEKKFYFQNEEFNETWMFLFEEATIPGTVCHVLPLQDNRPDDIFDMQVSLL